MMTRCLMLGSLICSLPMSSSSTPYPLRMSEELRERLTEQAKTHNRSLHAEIIGILQAAVDDPAHSVSAVSAVEIETLADALAARLLGKIKAAE